jgi:hypothetical protein
LSDQIKPTYNPEKPEIRMSLTKDFSLESIQDETIRNRISEKLASNNSLHTRMKVRIFYKGKNRNWTYINDKIAQEIIESLPNTPIVGEFWEVKSDFGTHGGMWKENAEGRLEYELTTRPYGVVPADTEVWYETIIDEDNVERTYLCAEVILWSARYEKELEVLLAESRPQSMELDPDSTYGKWEYDEETGDYLYHYKSAKLSALCILGKEIEPCFQGASFLSFSVNNEAWAEIKEQHAQMLTDFANKKIIDSEMLEERLKQFELNMAKNNEDEEAKAKNPPKKGQRPDGLVVFRKGFTHSNKGGNADMNEMKVTYMDEKDIRGIVFRALNAVNDNEVYELKYSVAEVKDNVATVYNYEDNTYYTVKFAIDGNNVSLESPVAVTPVFQTQEEIKAQATAQANYANVKAENVKLQGELTTAKSALKDYQLTDEEYSALTVKADKYDKILPQFTAMEKAVLEQERVAKEEILGKFENLGEADLKEFRDNIDKYSAEDLDIRLSALAFKKGVAAPVGEPQSQVLNFEVNPQTQSGNPSSWEAYVIAEEKKRNTFA